MFSLHDFVIETILKMVGNESEYKVRKYALTWYKEDLLTDEDMLQIEQALQPKVEENTEIIEENGGDTNVATIDENTETTETTETTEIVNAEVE